MSLFDRCGIEFETENLTQSTNGITQKDWQATHDASIETNYDFSRLGNLYLKRNTLLYKNGNRRTFGSEFVTLPLNLETEDILRRLKIITKDLSQMGEPAEGLRSGVHFHISFDSYNLDILKKMVHLGQNMEDIFFRLAGNGYMFRGVENDSIYCRPITSWGPQVVKTSWGDWVQIFTCKDLLEATTLSDFWYRYGGIRRTGRDNLNRYFPGRYTYLNFFSLLWHQTLEFRPFNKTLNPLFLWAEFQLCLTFCHALIEMPLKFAEKLPINSIFLQRSKEEICSNLVEFAEAFSLDQKALLILIDIIKMSPEFVLPLELISTHVRSDPGNYFNSDMSYKPKEIEYFRKPHFVDIHTLAHD